MDGNALGFGYLHVVQGLGVAPGFGRAAVAEFLAVAFFVPDDQHRLVEDLFAPASGDIGPGYEHGRVVGVLILTADFRVIVVHVFQNIAQTDALRVTHDAHFVHGGQPIFQLALHEKEQILQRAQSLFRVGHRAVLYAPLQFRQTLVQKADILLVLARENIAHVVQALRQLMQLLIPIHLVFLFFIRGSAPAPSPVRSTARSLEKMLRLADEVASVTS